MLPNFFLVGAEKSGTTWIYECLKKHPDVFLPSYRSEIHFFDRNYNKGLNWYEKKYGKYNGEKAVGDITPSYMQNPDIANLIYDNFPDAKIIFCLRNPIERIYSAYWHLYRNRKFNLSFDECFVQEHKIFKQSLYYDKVKKYYDLFPKENILILFYEDLKKDPLSFLNRICSFLEVESIDKVSEVDLSKKNNMAVEPKNIIFYRFMKRIVRRFRYFHCERVDWMINFIGKSRLRKLIEKPLRKQPIDKNLKKQILDYFLDDIGKLEDLLDADLSSWKHS